MNYACILARPGKPYSLRCVRFPRSNVSLSYERRTTSPHFYRKMACRCSLKRIRESTGWQPKTSLHLRSALIGGGNAKCNGARVRTRTTNLYPVEGSILIPVNPQNRGPTKWWQTTKQVSEPLIFQRGEQGLSTCVSTKQSAHSGKPLKEWLLR